MTRPENQEEAEMDSAVSEGKNGCYLVEVDYRLSRGYRATIAIPEHHFDSPPTVDEIWEFLEGDYAGTEYLAERADDQSWIGDDWIDSISEVKLSD